MIQHSKIEIYFILFLQFNKIDQTKSIIIPFFYFWGENSIIIRVYALNEQKSYRRTSML